MTLEKLIPAVPELIGGSADLTPAPTAPRPSTHKPVTPGKFDGNYIHYGVREHGMAAAMNGMALHGGFIPFGATFLVFTDYCRPSIRLSALMGSASIYVMTHDCIGSAKTARRISRSSIWRRCARSPNLQVLRPADAIETAECLGASHSRRTIARRCWH